MKHAAVDSLEACPSVDTPVVLTLGTFDGIHLGHQVVLKKVAELSQQKHTVSAAITFQKHPSVVLRPDHPKRPIITLDYKIALLHRHDIDIVITLDFTNALSQYSAEEFLQVVQEHIPFQTLVLGYDARLGHDRVGDTPRLQAIADRLKFSLVRVAPEDLGDAPVSSTRIRKDIELGNLNEASRMLGRPLAFYGKAQAGQGLGKTLGFPTLNLSITGLCLPPLGVYTVKILDGEDSYDGVANIGKAPTVRDDNEVWCEVHVFGFKHEIAEHVLEVQLLKFLRPEQRFANTEALKAQVQSDLATAMSAIKEHGQATDQ